MVYNILILSEHDIEITSLQKHVTYDILHLETLNKTKIEKFDPQIVIISTKNKDSSFLNNVHLLTKEARKILIYDHYDIYDYIEFNQFNISSIIENAKIQELLDGAIIKAIYEYCLFNSPKQITIQQNVIYDSQTGSLFSTDKKVQLSAIQKKFLEFLLAHPNNVHDYDTIVDKVWDEREKPTSKSSLKNLVGFFNKIHPEMIENRYGIGYKLNSTKNLDYLNVQINYLKTLNDFHTEFLSSLDVQKDTVQKALDKFREVFSAERACICEDFNPLNDYFLLSFLSTKEIHSHLSQPQKIPMVESQEMVMRQVLESDEPLCYNENPMLTAAIETSVFITEGHETAKSILISKFTTKNGTNYAIALHQLTQPMLYNDTEIALFKDFMSKFQFLFELYTNAK